MKASEWCVKNRERIKKVIEMHWSEFSGIVEQYNNSFEALQGTPSIPAADLISLQSTNIYSYDDAKVFFLLMFNDVYKEI